MEESNHSTLLQVLYLFQKLLYLKQKSTKAWDTEI